MHLKSKNLKCTSSNWKNKNMFISLNQLGGGREDQKSKKIQNIFITHIIFKTYFTKQKKARGRMEGKKSTGLIKNRPVLIEKSLGL